MARVSIGRSRLPPDEIRWLATSGIIATCDPVRDNMVVLTRSMSAATSSLRRSMVAGERLSNGTMTAKRRAPEWVPNARTWKHRNAMVTRQVRQNAHLRERTVSKRGELMKAIPVRAGDWQPRAAQSVAVLVPCFNEEATIGKVVADFRAALPEAAIYVYDNNSADRTGEGARAAGALVRRERHQGKGNVVRRMFADVDADLYVLVDGDATYDAASARAMIARLTEERLDMVVGARVDQEHAAYRLGHRTGNRLLSGFVTHIFGRSFSDILSGYRVFSRRFVKSFPVLSGGFEIETELTIHALELQLPVAEVDTPYYARPEGSASKLNTWRDGFRILWGIFQIYRSERPLPFFLVIGAASAIASIGLAIPI